MVDSIVQVTAEQIRLFAVEDLSKRELQNMPAEAVVEVCRDKYGSLRLMMTAKVYGMPQERIVIHKRWPADWWQAVRERWFPRWWLRRHPVRYERVDVDQTIYAAVCPHLHAAPRRSHLDWMGQQREA